MGVLSYQFDELKSDLRPVAILTGLVVASSALIRNLEYPSLTANLPKSKGIKDDIKFGLFLGTQALIYLGMVSGIRYYQGD